MKALFQAALALAVICKSPCAMAEVKTNSDARYMVGRETGNILGDENTTYTVRYAADFLQQHFYLKTENFSIPLEKWSFGSLRVSLLDRTILSINPDEGPLSDFSMDRIRLLHHTNWIDAWASEWKEIGSEPDDSPAHARFVASELPGEGRCMEPTTITVVLDRSTSLPISILHETDMSENGKAVIASTAFTFEWKDDPPMELRLGYIAGPDRIHIQSAQMAIPLLMSVDKTAQVADGLTTGVYVAP